MPGSQGRPVGRWSPGWPVFPAEASANVSVIAEGELMTVAIDIGGIRYKTLELLAVATFWYMVIAPVLSVRTMMVVTHEIGFAREVADRIIFMADGAIVEEGPAAAVVGSPQMERTQQFLYAVIH